MLFRSNASLVKYLAKNPNITVLDIEFSPHLTEIPPLPESLSVLEISHCNKLAVLPKLPKYLCALALYSCPQLKKLPKFPTYLSFVKVDNCSALEDFCTKYGWRSPDKDVTYWRKEVAEEDKIVARNLRRRLKRRQAS